MMGMEMDPERATYGTEGRTLDTVGVCLPERSERGHGGLDRRESGPLERARDTLTRGLSPLALRLPVVQHECVVGEFAAHAELQRPPVDGAVVVRCSGRWGRT